MQPYSDVKLTPQEFERLKRTVKNISEKKRNSTNLKVHSVPQEIGLQLTNKCNLRCTHCFEWNSDGYLLDLPTNERNDEIELSLIEKILKETKQANSNLFLWGGEPMVYSKWDDLCNLLKKDKRWTVLCTNGLFIREKMESLLKFSENLVLLTSIEGFEAQNDAIRGKGTYKKVLDGIEYVIELQKKGIFKGAQSVNCTIHDNMIGHLYDLAEFFEELGIDSLYFGFPWYIAPTQAMEMDKYFTRNFSWLYTAPKNKGSWNSFTYKISSEYIEPLLKDLERINKKKWKIRVNLQPSLTLNEVSHYVLGENLAAQGKTKCAALTTRMDVLANGHVSSCKLFQEFLVGNLHNQSVEEIWNGEDLNRIRTIVNESLMPVCSKCVLLYLNGL